MAQNVPSDAGVVPSTCSRSTGSRTRSTAATASAGSARSCCSASAGCARWRRSGSSRTSSTLNEGHSAFLQLERLRAGRARCRDRRRARVDPALVRRRPTRRCRRGTRFSTRSSSSAMSASSRRKAGSPTSRCCDSRALRRRAGVRADAVRAPALGLRERRLRAARTGRTGDVGGAPAGEEPHIGHVTNGVHVDGNWLDPALGELLPLRRRRHRRLPTRRTGPLPATSAATLPGACTRRPRPASPGDAGFDRDLLTIGFAPPLCSLQARRSRLLRRRAAAGLPVQVVVAGKAHPADVQGKDVMQEIVALARDAWADVLPQELRHGRRPRDGPGAATSG